MVGPVRHTLSDALTEQVLALIREDELRPGDRLPSAKAMAERFEVATPTLREALRRLQATGAVEIRHGSGVYVSETMDRLVIPNPNLHGLQGEQFQQLLDARVLVEPHLAGLAAQRQDQADLQELRDVLATAERHLSGNPGDDVALHEANMAFHRAVAAASGNGVLYEVMDSLLRGHSGHQLEILQLFDDRTRDHQEHRAVLDAIASGDVTGAGRLMREHLDDVKDVVARRAGGGG